MNIVDPVSAAARAALPLMLLASMHAGDFEARSHGAVGDGVAEDTWAIQAAVDACAAAGGGRVVLGPGIHLVRTLQLRSGVELHLPAGSVLRGLGDPAAYSGYSGNDPRLPARNRLRSLVIAEGATRIAITGAGMIDGAGITDPAGEERIRGPHAVMFGGCSDVSIRGVTISDAGNYAILLHHCRQVVIEDATCIGGWDGVHIRGSAEDWSEDLVVRRCRFITGDDSFAGCFLRRTIIEDCTVSSACNGVRVIGPVQDFTVQRSSFTGPCARPHRTSGRTSMLAGICIQPASWDARMAGASARIVLADLDMAAVTTALHVVAIAGCTIDGLRVERLRAHAQYRAPLSIEAWDGGRIADVELRGIDAGWRIVDRNLRPFARPGKDARALPVWGMFVRAVDGLACAEVDLRLEGPDARPAVEFQEVLPGAPRGIRVHAAQPPSTDSATP